MANPNSGHTAGNITLGVDGLRDGDVITSPSLTNLIEGTHGNGIIRLQDTAYGMGGRNEVMTNAPGHCVRASAFTLTVHGGYVILDGCLYSFANGPGASVTPNIQNTENYCTSTTTGAGQEVLYTVYLVASSNAAHSNAHVRVLGGTPTTSSTGVYPPTPEGFLTDPITGYSELNAHSVVLCVIRAIHKSSSGGADMIDIVEVNDKRVFLNTSPKYMTPITMSTTDPNANTVVRENNKGVNTDVQLKELFGSGHVESGDFGGSHSGPSRIDVSALWVSHQNWDTPAATPPVSGDADYGMGIAGGKDNSADTPTDVLYFSGQGNAVQSAATGGAMFTTRLGSRGVDVGTWTKGSGGSVNWPITSNGDSVFIINVATGGSTLNLVPTGEFPEGHMIDVKLSGGAGALQFNGNGVAAYEKWVYDGTSWYQLI